MPLAWERLIPDVQKKLKHISQIYPKWTNWREQLMVRLFVDGPPTRTPRHWSQYGFPAGGAFAGASRGELRR
jgi:hypothetical protein